MIDRYANDLKTRVMLQIRKVISGHPEVVALGLKENDQIYFSPNVMYHAGVKPPLEVQIVDAAGQTVDTDGNVRREDFRVTIGLIAINVKDSYQRYNEFLQDLAKSLWTWERIIKTALNGNFLPISQQPDGTILEEDELLTRPLIYRGYGMNTLYQAQNCLIKELYYTAGINDRIPQ